MVVLATVAVAQGWFLFELFRQNGRILARLDDLQGNGGGIPAMKQAAANGNGNGHQPGLPVGVPAPDFALASVSGEKVSLSELWSRELPVLLLFSDPGCGPCNALLPEVGGWQREHAAGLTIALVSRGGMERNESKVTEHGLGNVVLQEDREVAEAYQAHGTPAGVLISPEGRIASSLALGPEAIRGLVASAIRSPLQVLAPAANGAGLPQHPAGLPVGVQAPELEWSDLNGEPVSLRALGGSPATLIFWNPRCGFCQRMTDDLRAWRETADGHDHHAILISSGTVEQNRALGLEMPIVIDNAFRAGRLFGVTGTPSAIPITSEGKIAGSPVVGAAAILGLVGAPA